MKYRVYLLAFLMLIGICTLPVCAGRPLETEDTPTVGKGNVSVEINQDWTTGWDGETASFTGGLVNYGLTDNLDLRVAKGTGLFTDAARNVNRGNTDTFLLLKYRFLEQTDSLPSMGIEPYVDLNDGNPIAGSGGTEWGLNFFATREMKSGLKLHANLGYTAVNLRRGFTGNDLINYSVAFEQPLGKRWGLAGEVVGRSTRNGPGPSTAAIGATYNVSPSVILDVSYARGLNRATYRQRFTIGTTINF